MTEYKITNTVPSDLKNAIKEYAVTPEGTDGAKNQKENYHTFDKFEQYFAYYKTIPELRVVIDTIARWTVGKGFEADPITEMVLGTIRATQKDSFNTILENMIRIYMINGDAFAVSLNNSFTKDAGNIKLITKFN